MDIIIRELKNYFTNLKDTKIPQERDELLHTYNKFAYELNKITKTNPNALRSIMQGGASAIDQRHAETLAKTATIFRQFNEIDASAIKRNATEIDVQLDKLLGSLTELEQDIAKFNKPENQDSFVNKHAIMNALDTVRVNMEQMNKGIKIYPSANAINIPIQPMDVKVKAESEFALMLKTMQNELEKIQKEIKISGSTNEETMRQLKEKIDTIISDMISEVEKMNTIHTDVENIERKFQESLDINIEDQDIYIIDTIHELQKRIDNINSTDDHFNLFKQQMQGLYYQLNNKKIRDRTYIDAYNAGIIKFDKKYDLPERYFNGRYTTRLSNEMIKNPNEVIPKMSLVNDILETEYGKITQVDQLKDIYSPNFESIKQKIRSKRQIGGNFNDFQTAVNKFADEMAKYTIKYEQYKTDIKLYNKIYTSNIAHSIFLMLVIFNRLFTNYYVVYTYINRGTIEFYRRIITGIINKIKKNDNSDEVIYMRKYHLVTICKLYNFLIKLSANQRIKPDSVIEIGRCSPHVINRFTLLNYFKTIMESYNESFQHKITIFARINDFKAGQTPEIKHKNKMFMSDYDRKSYYLEEGDNTLKDNLVIKEGANHIDGINKADIDPSYMWLRSNACQSLMQMKEDHNQNPSFVEKIQFTEVFDSTHFPHNGSISKYMSLDTQLAKGKAVAIMTYGYSGTGKTYTLFGDRERGAEGLLQATLDNINGLESVQFRLFEIYGLGLPYPNYWTDENTGKSRLTEIMNMIYHYKLRTELDSFTFDDKDVIKYDADQIERYMTDQTTYYEVQGTNIERIFGNFDQFVGRVDDHRLGNKRIVSFDAPKRILPTMNNKVSSRSVIVYDFKLKLTGSDDRVPFLIIDLPGREDIIQTYVDPYINPNNNIIQKIMKESLNSKFSEHMAKLKLLLTSLSLNPVAVPIFDPSTFKKFINNLHKTHNDVLQKLVEETIHMTFEVNNDKFKIKVENPYGEPTEKVNPNYKSMKIHVVEGNVRLLEELINRKGTMLEKFIHFDKGIFTVKSKGGYGYDKHNDLQYFALLGTHIMNRLIKMNRFDIINELYGEIINNMYNIHIDNHIAKLNDSDIDSYLKNLMAYGFQSDYINTHLTSKKISDRQFLKEILRYDYYQTPFEGIYINENIIGLIKFMADKFLVSDEQERQHFLTEKISKQNPALNFQYQHKVARRWLMSQEPGPQAESLEDFFGFKTKVGEGEIAEIIPPNIVTSVEENIMNFNMANINSEYERIRNMYRSDKIFNYDKPLITDILKHYVGTGIPNEKNIISDYKIFYLFGNYENDETRELKCKHQYSLLGATRDFVDIIVKI